ncbi:MAG: hypothetical protein K0S01_1646 [Herbinix sp.]|jgi:hypothetical protein|nr:hypothetical protein [Herbinix sp.]
MKLLQMHGKLGLQSVLNYTGISKRKKVLATPKSKELQALKYYSLIKKIVEMSGVISCPSPLLFVSPVYLFTFIKIICFSFNDSCTLMTL